MFRNLFSKKEKRFVCCVDTNFIEGTILKTIEKDDWNIRIKEDLRLKSLRESNSLLLINDINIYEIKSKLIKEFSVPIDKIDYLYNSAMNNFPNIKRISIKEIKISPNLINWMLKHKLSLKDGLLIDIAQGLKLPFVTTERKANEWKRAYEGILTQDDFWREIRRI